MYEVYDLRSEFAAIQKKELDYQAEGHVHDDDMLSAARGDAIRAYAIRPYG
jgi:DNA repair exonuclease SbcCD nuclease subunit